MTETNGSDHPGARLGRYELRLELGRGSMGVVWEAFDPDLGRTVALKTIRADLPDAASRESFEQRFFTEARIAARLQHPGIVVVHDVGRDPASGTLFMALEFLRGQTLAQRIATAGALPWREAAVLMAKVARALHFAHEQGVVHRDIKPANVMIQEAGEPKLLDFGVAQLEAALGALTSPGGFVGTPLFASPEQVRGETMDRRSDVFSLGAVAYAAFTGRSAFGAETLVGIIARVANEEPPAPSSLVPGVPSGIDVILKTALAKDRRHRYADALTLAVDLETVVAGESQNEAAVLAPTLVGPAALEPSDVGSPLAELLASGLPTHPGEDDTLETSLFPWGRRGAWVMAALALAIVLGTGGFLLRERWLPGGTPPGEERQSATRHAVTPAPARGATATPKPESAHLRVVFEHPLDAVDLGIYVDGDLALKRTVTGQKKRIPALKLRSGRLVEVLDVTPGRRTILVETEWSEGSRVETTSAEFESGKTLTLEASLGRLRKSLSLEWK